MKQFIIILLGLSMAWQSYGCDVCGSAGGNSLGILPQFTKHFIGLRCNFQKFAVTHPAFHTGSISRTQTQTFSTIDVWGRFYPAKRLQIFAFLPYEINTFWSETGKLISLQGIGDATIMGNYVLLDSPEDSTGEKVRHLLMAGGGLKTPTGKRVRMVGNELLNPNLDPGTGAFEFLLNSSYTVRYKKAGVNAEAMLKLPAASADIKYRLGNRLSSSLKGFVWKDIANAAILPNIGCALDIFGKDRWNGTIQELSGGHLLSAHIGMDIYYKSFLFGANLRSPIEQHLSMGYTEARTSLNANLVYFIP